MKYLVKMTCRCRLEPHELVMAGRENRKNRFKSCPKHFGEGKIYGYISWCEGCGKELLTLNSGGVPAGRCDICRKEKDKEIHRKSVLNSQRKKHKRLRKLKADGENVYNCNHFKTTCGWCLMAKSPMNCKMFKDQACPCGSGKLVRDCCWPNGLKDPDRSRWVG